MNKKLIESLAKLAKVKDVEEFSKALQSEEDTGFSLDLDNLTVRTKEEDAEVRNNILEESKKKNFTDAFEIQIKNMKKDLGLEFEGKRQEDFIESFKKKILTDAKIEPDKKINELNQSLEALRGQLTQKDQEFLNFKETVKSEKQKFKAQSLIPELPKELGLTKDEAVSLYFMNHESKEDGIYVNGEKQKNDLEKPLSLEDSVKQFVESKGWNKESFTGRGGGSQNQGQQSTLPKNEEEFNSYIQSKGWNLGSTEANALLVEMAKAQNE